MWFWFSCPWWLVTSSSPADIWICLLSFKDAHVSTIVKQIESFLYLWAPSTFPFASYAILLGKPPVAALLWDLVVLPTLTSHTWWYLTLRSSSFLLKDKSLGLIIDTCFCCFSPISGCSFSVFWELGFSYSAHSKSSPSSSPLSLSSNVWYVCMCGACLLTS